MRRVGRFQTSTLAYCTVLYCTVVVLLHRRIHTTTYTPISATQRTTEAHLYIPVRVYIYVPVSDWTHWDLNPGPPACEADASCDKKLVARYSLKSLFQGIACDTSASRSIFLGIMRQFVRQFSCRTKHFPVARGRIRVVGRKTVSHEKFGCRTKHMSRRTGQIGHRTCIPLVRRLQHPCDTTYASCRSSHISCRICPEDVAQVSQTYPTRLQRVVHMSHTYPTRVQWSPADVPRVSHTALTAVWRVRIHCPSPPSFLLLPTPPYDSGTEGRTFLRSIEVHPVLCDLCCRCR